MKLLELNVFQLAASCDVLSGHGISEPIRANRYENFPGASNKSSDTKPVEYLSFSAPHPAMKHVFPSITGSPGSCKQAGFIVGES